MALLYYLFILRTVLKTQLLYFMKVFRLFILALVVSAIGFYSCKKDAHTIVTSDAVIRNTNPLEGEGCGFVINVQTNNTTYSPTNLTDEFKPADTLKVHVTYKLLSTTHSCGSLSDIGGGFKEIEIQSISKIDN